MDSAFTSPTRKHATDKPFCLLLSSCIRLISYLLRNNTLGWNSHSLECTTTHRRAGHIEYALCLNCARASHGHDSPLTNAQLRNRRAPCARGTDNNRALDPNMQTLLQSHYKHLRRLLAALVASYPHPGMLQVHLVVPVSRHFSDNMRPMPSKTESPISHHLLYVFPHFTASKQAMGFLRS
jgi:hypothetical protein